jgi:hypothetical protein
MSYPYPLPLRPYPIPHTRIRNSESGIWKSGKLWCGLMHFHSTPVNIGPNAVQEIFMVRCISRLTRRDVVR